MTPKQEDRIRQKINSIRQTLAAERRKFGSYDNSRGLRYLPPNLFLKLGDYKGGLTYLRWFEKNFPDDGGFPPFLLEWTIILFKNGKLPEAEQKALKTYKANAYLFDAFFGHPIQRQPFQHWSNWEEPVMAEGLPYPSSQPGLTDFSEWLKSFTTSERFVQFKEQVLELKARLEVEEHPEKRRELIRALRDLV